MWLIFELVHPNRFQKEDHLEAENQQGNKKRINFLKCLDILYEPTRKILAVFVLGKVILQIRMRSQPVGLDV